MYQNDLDNLNTCMTMNGLTLSKDNINILFYNGDDPSNLQTLKLDGECLQYARLDKFLGVFLTSKSTWNYHIKYILNKARKSLISIKMINGQHWGQDILALNHL